MHCRTVKCALVLCYFIVDSHSLGISSKLDFDGAKLIKSVPKTVTQNLKNGHDLETIGIVCISEGCNGTESKTSSGDIETDILVHVKTNVNLNRNKTQIEDTPDVPVVVGLAGSAPDSNRDQLYSDNPFLNSAKAPTLSSTFTPMFLVPKIGVEPANRRTYPSVTITANDDNRRRFSTNGIQMHVPYFEPTYNNHYFGEHPPPSLTWHSNGGANLNPVEFRNAAKPNWNPSFWANQFRPVVYEKHAAPNGERCHCKSLPNTGLQWYPGRAVYSEDPGSQINDKLAKLN